MATYTFKKDFEGKWNLMSPPFTENKKIFKAGQKISASNYIDKTGKFVYTTLEGKSADVAMVGMPVIQIPLEYLTPYVGGEAIPPEKEKVESKYRLLNDIVLQKGQTVPCQIPPCPVFGEIKLSKGTVINGTPISPYDWKVFNMKQNPIRPYTMDAPSKEITGLLYYHNFGAAANVKVKAKPLFLPLNNFEKVEATDTETKSTTETEKSGFPTWAWFAIGGVVLVAIAGILKWKKVF